MKDNDTPYICTLLLIRWTGLDRLSEKYFQKQKIQYNLILSEISELAFTKGSVSNQQKHQEKLADKQVLIPTTFQISSRAEVPIN